MIKLKIEVPRKHGEPYEFVIEYPYIDVQQCDFTKKPRILAMGHGTVEWKYQLEPDKAKSR